MSEPNGYNILFQLNFKRIYVRQILSKKFKKNYTLSKSNTLGHEW